MSASLLFPTAPPGEVFLVFRVVTSSRTTINDGKPHDQERGSQGKGAVPALFYTFKHPCTHGISDDFTNMTNHSSMKHLDFKNEAFFSVNKTEAVLIHAASIL